MFDLKPLIFVMCRWTALFCCIEDSQGNRHPKSKCLFVRELPTPFRQGASEKFLSRIPPPMVSNQPSVFLHTFGGSNRGRNRLKTGLFCSGIYFPRFLNIDILHQVSRLTLQQRTKCIKGFPRHQFSVSDLL